MRMIDPYSVCAVPVQIMSKDVLLGSATGFFWQQEARIFLVSNWHVYSGRNPQTGQSVDQKTYLLPDRVVVAGHPRANLATIFRISVPLSDDAGVAWWQHKHHGQKVDVAAVEISKLIGEAASQNSIDARPFCINDMPAVEDMATIIGSDIFILGFPRGLMKTGVFPIWKRGSIATEYDYDVDDLPSFLVDTATREGMSGGPVLSRSIGGYSSSSGGSAVGPGTFTRFLGVYSGRHVGGIDEAHLGIVWKKSLIEEIIHDPVPGDFEILP